MRLTAWFDGAVEQHNPGGTGSWGYVLRLEDETLYGEGMGSVRAAPTTTNNLCEYLALIKALERILLAVKSGPVVFDEIVILGDSKLVVFQLTGAWSCRAANLQPLLAEAKDLINHIKLPCTARWVPREHNQEADALSQRAWTEATGKPFPERVRK